MFIPPSARHTALQAAILLFLLSIPCPVLSIDSQPLYKDNFVEVTSISPAATRAQAKQAAEMIKAAWKFDMSVMQWSNPELMKRPIHLKLVGDEQAKEAMRGMRGMAHSNGTDFEMRLGLLDDPTGTHTIAHELGHLQMFRVVNHHSVPYYFMEGHGLMMNHLYGTKLNTVHPHRPQAKTIMKLTPEEVTQIYFDDKDYTQHEHVNVGKMETMGQYFVEYLITTYKGGDPNAVRKMARVFERIGRGEKYTPAFKAVYGVPPAEIANDIVKLFKKTADHPEERLKGTLFDDVANGTTEKKK